MLPSLQTNVDFEWASWVVVSAAVLAVVVPLAATAVAVRARRAARQEGTPSVALAAVALLVVRVGIGIAVLWAPLGLIPSLSEDRSLGDRVLIEDYGFSYQGKNGLVEVEGPWLVLKRSASFVMCPPENAQRPSEDPEPLYLEGAQNCQTMRDITREYGEVEVLGAHLAKRVQQPPPSVGTKLDLLRLAGYAFALLAAFALERILRLTALRRPFTRPTVRWLRVLAGAVAGVGIFVPLLVDRFVDGLMQQYFPAAAGMAADRWTLELAPVLIVLLILVLAEVWRLGTRLQEDVEATV